MDRDLENYAFISVILVMDKNFHLAMKTLKSINDQTFKDFEIFIVYNKATQKEIQAIRGCSKKNVKAIHEVKSNVIPHMMNEGIKISSGKYVQFLRCGETYLSNHSLENGVALMYNKNRYIDFLYSVPLVREENFPVEACEREIIIDDLSKGKLKTMLAGAIFSRKFLKKIEGFDTNYEREYFFEMVCRIFVPIDECRCGEEGVKSIVDKYVGGVQALCKDAVCKDAVCKDAERVRGCGLRSHCNDIDFYKKVFVDHTFIKESSKCKIDSIKERRKIIKRFFGFKKSILFFIKALWTVFSCARYR